MNRRFAALGLALAMCGTGSVVAGQTAQKDTPVATTPASPSTGGVSNLVLLSASAQQLGNTVSFRVEPVEPQRMRLSIIDSGVEKATVEASGITVTTGPDGTTVTTGTVAVATSDGKKLAFEGLTLHLTLNGNYWFALRQ